MKLPLAERLAPHRKPLVAAICNVAVFSLASLWQMAPQTWPGLAALLGALMCAVMAPLLVYALPNDTVLPRPDLTNTVATLRETRPAITPNDVAHVLVLLRRLAASLSQLSSNAHLGELLRRQQLADASRRRSPAMHPDPPGERVLPAAPPVQSGDAPSNDFFADETPISK